jgi:hypothetical protein
LPAFSIKCIAGDKKIMADVFGHSNFVTFIVHKLPGIPLGEKLGGPGSNMEPRHTQQIPIQCHTFSFDCLIHAPYPQDMFPWEVFI